MIFAIQSLIEDYIHATGGRIDDAYAVQVARLYVRRRLKLEIEEFAAAVRRIPTVLFLNNDLGSRSDFERKLLKRVDKEFLESLRQESASSERRPQQISGSVVAEIDQLGQQISAMDHQLTRYGDAVVDRLSQLDEHDQEVLKKIGTMYDGLMRVLTDEAKDGPRLFSLVPVDRSKFNPREWGRAKFRLTLWCEHSSLPLPMLNQEESKQGVYEIELTRDWFRKVGPYLKLMTGTLGLVLPVASSAIKLALDDDVYKSIEEQLEFGKNAIEASLDEIETLGEFMGPAESNSLEHGESIRASGAALRQLHAVIKHRDPGYGGLVRVMNENNEFLWVHPKFEGEY